MEPGTVKSPALRKRRASESGIETTTASSKKQKVTTPKSATPVRNSPRRTPKTTPKRRPKKVPDLPENLWSVSDILCEDVRTRRLWFLVVWSGNDPEIGKPWDHSYEPAENVGHELRKAWNLKKAAIQNAKGVKDREIAARKTIHWYAANGGIETTEYKHQLESGTLKKGLLAQESPCYVSASFPSPEVRRYHNRTVLSSSEAGSPSELSSPPSQLNSEDLVEPSSVITQPSASQTQHQLSYESPARNQILNIDLPPPLSQPEAYELVTASQLRDSPSSGPQEETSEGGSVQSTEASSVEEQRLFIPDSQSLLQESLETQSLSCGSNRNYNSSKGETESSHFSQQRGSAAETAAPALIQDSQQNLQDRGPLLNDETADPVQLQQNSLGFTHSDRTTTPSTSQEPHSPSSLAAAYVIDISHSQLRRSGSENLEVLCEPQVHNRARNYTNSVATDAEVFDIPVEGNDSVQDLTISGFESQIPFIASQQPVRSVSISQSLLTGSASASAEENQDRLQQRRESPAADAGSDSGDLDYQKSIFSPKAPGSLIFENSIANSTVSEVESPPQDNTYSSLARAPSQSPVALIDSHLPARPVTPLQETDITSLKMSSGRKETDWEEFERNRDRIWGIKSLSSSKPSTPSSRNSPGPPKPILKTKEAFSEAGASPSDPEKNSGISPGSAAGAAQPQSAMQPGVGDWDIYLSLPLENRARELYRNIFQAHKDVFDGIANGSVTSQQADVASKVATARAQLFDVCAHMDLVDNETWPDTQFPMSDATQNEWTGAVSSKCSFLKGLIQGASEAEKHIIVYAKEGRFMDILERFLKGMDVNFSRPEKHVHSEGSEGNIRVTLLETSSEATVDGADLVLGFDETFDPRRAQVMLNRQHFKSGTPCPSICLVVHHSIEHLWWNFSSLRDESPLARERLVLNSRLYANQAGELGTEDRAPDELGETVASLLLSSEPPQTWKLPSVFNFQLDQFRDGLRVAANATLLPIENDTTSAAVSDVSSEARKRPLDTISSEIDVATSVKRPRQVLNDLTHEEAQKFSRDEIAAKEDSTMTESVIETSVVPSGIDPSSVVEVMASADVLRTSLKAKETSLRELEAELGKLQTRFEEQSKQNHRLQTALTNEQSAVLSTTSRANKLSDSNTGLRTEQSKLREEITTLRESLAGSSDTMAKTIGELQAKASRADAVEKRLEASKNELEFVRKNYQEASGAAKEHADEVAELRQENERLKHKASAQAVRLREMFMDRTSNALRDQLKRQEAEKLHKDRALQNALEENQRLKLRLEQEERRAGMSISTRSSSLPVQEPGPAALAAAKVFHGTQPSRTSAVGAARSGVRGTVSANASRAASPATGHTGRGTLRTSPLQQSVGLAERD